MEQHLHHHHKRTSEVLADLKVSLTGEDRVTVAQICTHLGSRVFGLGMFIFAFPNALPIPNIPGFSALTGIPILIIAVQLMRGGHRLWLPAKIAGASFPVPMLMRALDLAIPYVVKAERFLKPRLHFMHSPIGLRVLGVFVFVLALVMSLPIPFSNFLPGICIAILAMGLIERDGLAIMLGIGLGCVAIVLISRLVGVLFKWLGKNIALWFAS